MPNGQSKGNGSGNGQSNGHGNGNGRGDGNGSRSGASQANGRSTGQTGSQGNGQPTGTGISNGNGHQTGNGNRSGSGSGSNRSVTGASPSALTTAQQKALTAGRPKKTSGSGSNPSAPAPATRLLLVAHIPDTVAVRPEASFTLPLLAAPSAPLGSCSPRAHPGRAPLAPGGAGLTLPNIGRRLWKMPGDLLNGGWAGQSVKAADKLKFPIGFLAVAAGFLLFQAFIDRRDPKLHDAPEHQGEDSVEFE